MPKMEGGVLVEHSHRLAAGTVVILTLALATMLSMSRPGAAAAPVRVAGGRPGYRSSAAEKSRCARRRRVSSARDLCCSSYDPLCRGAFAARAHCA
jgi:hypothetical protein